MDLTNAKTIHCIGIGGIGISAIARYLISNGKKVSGSDTNGSLLVDQLMKEGIEISIGSSESTIPNDCDLVIYTIAISAEDKEFIEAKKRDIKCLSYPEALGELTRNYKTIAIAGTHGKTTTTAMFYYAFKACGINPTLIVGSLLKDGNTNFIKGDSEYLIVEACEYRRSFLNLHPTYAIITNIDSDHLDYYKDLDDIKLAFQEFSDRVNKNGFIVSHASIELNHENIINADDEKDPILLSVLGQHNKDNARLVYALCLKLGFDREKIKQGLLNFPGTWRRLEYKGKTSKGVRVYDDYGHHPTEIKASLSAVIENFKDCKFIVFFQPHLYSRTKIFFDEFVESLSLADRVYVLPIFAARELIDPSISSEMLADELIKKGVDAKAILNSEEMKEIILSLDDTSMVVLNIGAGDAYKALNGIEYKL